jgi:hypothetical protein
MRKNRFVGGSLWGFVTKHPTIINNLLSAIHAGVAAAAVGGIAYGIKKAITG